MRIPLLNIGIFILTITGVVGLNSSGSCVSVSKSEIFRENILS